MIRTIPRIRTRRGVVVAVIVIALIVIMVVRSSGEGNGNEDIGPISNKEKAKKEKHQVQS
jgi:hypothetical protein